MVLVIPAMILNIPTMILIPNDFSYKWYHKMQKITMILVLPTMILVIPTMILVAKNMSLIIKNYEFAFF